MMAYPGMNGPVGEPSPHERSPYYDERRMRPIRPIRPMMVAPRPAFPSGRRPVRAIEQQIANVQAQQEAAQRAVAAAQAGDPNKKNKKNRNLLIGGAIGLGVIGLAIAMSKKKRKRR